MKSRTSACLLFALAGPPGGLGCDPPDPPAAATSVRAASTDAPRVARRGRLISGERVARSVRWPAPTRIEHTVRERMSPALRSVIADAPVPVLVPRDPAWTAGARLSSPRDPKGGPGYGYAFSARRGGVTLAIQASRVATLVPGIGRVDGPERVRGQAAWLTDNDGIKSAAWLEHGVAYAVDLECEAPAACDVAALRAVVEDLAYVGGAGEEDGR